MASPLQADGEDLLQAALSDAFSVSDLPREPVTPSRSVPSLPPQTTTATTTTTSTTSTSPPPESVATSAPIKPDAEAEALGLEAFEAWKADYDVQQARWKAENAEQRAKAEAERAKWEAIRAAEKGGEGADAGAGAEGVEEGMSVSVGASSEVWERLLAERHMAGGSPSPVDGRDVVAGDKHTAATDQDTAAAPNSNTDTSSPRWEDVPSDPSELTSSFPSLSFPSHSKHASGSNNSHPHPNPSSSHHTHSHPNDGRRRQDSTTATATLAVFDSTLSARTRVWALVGSLGVNLLLPFVNGVMLGFGEIFARDVLVGWFGWNSRGTTGAGLRTGSSWFRRQ